MIVYLEDRPLKNSTLSSYLQDNIQSIEGVALK